MIRYLGEPVLPNRSFHHLRGPPLPGLCVHPPKTTATGPDRIDPARSSEHQLQSPPLQRVPDQRVPLKSLPLQRVPVQPVPLQRVPDQSAPDQRGPDQRVPLHRVPLQSTELQRVPAQASPDQRVPFQVPPLQAAPMADSGAQVAGVHAVPKMSYSPERTSPVSASTRSVEPRAASSEPRPVAGAHGCALSSTLGVGRLLSVVRVSTPAPWPRRSAFGSF